MSIWAAIERYERARESLDVVRALDPWATDAFLEDKPTGQYLDPARVRPGPTIAARTSRSKDRSMSRAHRRGQLVVFMAGQSEAGNELAAYGGEGLFGTASSKAEAQAGICRHQGPDGEVRPPDRRR